MKETVARVFVTVFMLVVAFFAGQHFSSTAAAQGRAKWEYQIVGSFHTVEQMNKLGDEGWEAITLNASNRVLLKRSK